METFPIFAATRCKKLEVAGRLTLVRAGFLFYHNSTHLSRGKLKKFYFFIFSRNSLSRGRLPEINRNFFQKSIDSSRLLCYTIRVVSKGGKPIKKK